MRKLTINTLTRELIYDQKPTGIRYSEEAIIDAVKGDYKIRLAIIIALYKELIPLVNPTKEECRNILAALKKTFYV